MSPHRRLRYLTLCAALFPFLAVPTGSLAGDRTLDEASGFIIDDGWQLTNAHCASCHSAQLITSIRLDRNGWEDIIRLMQAEHGLWDLGDAEPAILDYLTRHYGISDTRSRIRKGMLGTE